MTPWELALVIAAAVLAAAAVVTAVLAGRRKKLAPPAYALAAPAATPTAPADVRASQVCDDIRDLMAQLDRLAQQIDGRVETRLADLQKLLAAADERVTQLRALLEAPQPATPAIKIREGLNNEILRLHREGADSVEIARTMRMDVGEVELILSLQRTGRLRQA